MLLNSYISPVQRFGDTGLGSVNWKDPKAKKTKAKKSVPKIAKKVKSPKTHACPVCKRLFRSPAGVDAHRAALHPKPQPTAPKPALSKPSPAVPDKLAASVKRWEKIEVVHDPLHSSPFSHLRLAGQVEPLYPHAHVERTSEIVQIDLRGRKEGSILLLFLPDILEVRLRAIEWPSPSTPVIGSEVWQRVTYEELTAGKVAILVAEAERHWNSRKVRCKKCGKQFPPERMTDLNGSSFCHGCAERHHGVVY